jgi:hypothetical protein
MSGFENNIVNASNELTRSSMESPNYVHGVSGWTINKDGTAEFNNLTVRGTFYGLNFVLNNTGLFFYSGPPALGNLVLSIVGSVSGTDAYGNVYKPGVAIYKGNALANLIVDPTQGVPALNLPTGNASESQFGSIYTIGGNVGAPNEYSTLWIKGPASSNDNNSASIALITTYKDGSALFDGNLMVGGTSIAYWTTNGLHLETPLWGAAGILNIGDNLLMAPGKGIVGRDPNWVTVGLASGWTNRGGNYPTFQVMRVSVSPGICWIRGNVQTANSITNGFTFATFGASYTPLLVQSIPFWVAGGTAVFNNTMHIEVTVAGAVNLWGIATAGTVQIGFSGLIFLDAL